MALDWGSFTAGGVVTAAGAVVVRLTEAYFKHRLDLSKADHDQKIRKQDEERQQRQLRDEEERRVALARQNEADHQAELHGDQLVELANLKAAIERAIDPINIILAFRDLESFFQAYPQYSMCRKENKEFFVRFTEEIVTRKLSPSSNSSRVLEAQSEFAADLKLAVEDLQLPTLDQIREFKSRQGQIPARLVAPTEGLEKNQE